MEIKSTTPNAAVTENYNSKWRPPCKKKSFRKGEEKARKHGKFSQFTDLNGLPTGAGGTVCSMYNYLV